MSSKNQSQYRTEARTVIHSTTKLDMHGLNSVSFKRNIKPTGMEDFGIYFVGPGAMSQATGTIPERMMHDNSHIGC